MVRSTSRIITVAWGRSITVVGAGSITVARAKSMTVVGAIALACAVGCAVGCAPAGARVLDGTDTAHLHLVQQRETVVFEEGAATGALPGHMHAQLEVGSVFAGSCTIYTSGGTITGHGRATPHGSGRYQSFHGTLTIIGGTGRYAHAHGQTGLYGTFDRRTFALVIQTTGSIFY